MSSETSSSFVVDPGFNFESNLSDFSKTNLNTFVESNFDEKPPLTALGEVVELIGQPWGNELGSFVPKQEESVFPSSTICKTCFQPINDRFLLKIGESYVHEQCSRCVICSQPLGEKCYEKNNQFYCHLHYYNEYSPFKCSGCRCGISPTDMVYKLKDEIIYHVSCHSCFQCGKHLSPGEQIIVDEVSKMVCCSSHQNEKNQSFENFFQKSPEKEVKPVLKKSSENSASIHTVASLIPQYPFEMYAFGEMCGDDSRFTKRRGPRTTIKQSQLDVLNRIFSSTPKPSKHARAKLALETGLSMRVIQVWFQNRRSKERRLKHLCNFLRHYEQKGIVPPPFGFNPEDGTLIGEPFSPSTLQSFDPNFSFEEDSAELSS